MSDRLLTREEVEEISSSTYRKARGGRESGASITEALELVHHAIRDAQDTKSFKDGYDKGNADGIAKGRAEVVEWMEKNTKQFQGYPYYDEDEWREQLKAWGLGDKAG